MGTFGTVWLEVELLIGTLSMESTVSKISSATPLSSC